MTCAHALEPPPTQTTLALIHARVSDDRSGVERSVDEQESLDRAACAEHGWTLGREPIREVGSAARSRRGRKARERKDLLAVLAELGTGRYGVYVTWKMNRTGREAELGLRVLRVCQERGTLIHVTAHRRTYDPNVARDWQTLAGDLVKAQGDNDEQSEDITRALAANAEQGRPHGRVLYGYVREYDAIWRKPWPDRKSRRLSASLLTPRSGESIGFGPALCAGTPASRACG